MTDDTGEPKAPPPRSFDAECPHCEATATLLARLEIPLEPLADTDEEIQAAILHTRDAIHDVARLAMKAGLTDLAHAMGCLILLTEACDSADEVWENMSDIKDHLSILAEMHLTSAPAEEPAGWNLPLDSKKVH